MVKWLKVSNKLPKSKIVNHNVLTGFIISAESFIGEFTNFEI